MAKLVLIVGFLGAGKTTLLQNILESHNSGKTGVIVNEFGSVNIDGQLIAQKKGEMEMIELSNGSIFCACIKDKFVDGLIDLASRDLDYVFVEASGLADPASVGTVVDNLRKIVKTPYDYKGAICVVDAETFLELYDILPAMSAQLKFCGAALINKSDIVPLKQLEEVIQEVSAISPHAQIYITNHCSVDVSEVVDNLRISPMIPTASSNTEENRPLSFVLKGKEQLPYDGLEAFLGAICKDTYRIKGFASTDKGNYEISCVGKHINIKEWSQPVEENEIVVISSIGNQFIGTLVTSLNEHLKGLLQI